MNITPNKAETRSEPRDPYHTVKRLLRVFLLKGQTPLGEQNEFYLLTNRLLLQNASQI